MSDRVTEGLRQLAATHVTVPPLDAVRRRRDTRRRRRSVAAAVATVIVVGGGLLGYAVTGSTGQRATTTRPAPPPTGKSPSPKPASPFEVPVSVMLTGADFPAAPRLRRVADDLLAGDARARPRWTACVAGRAEKPAQPWNRDVIGERTRALSNDSIYVTEVVRQYRFDLAPQPLFDALRRSVAACPTHAWTRVPARPFAGQGSILATTRYGAAIALFVENTTVVSVTVEGLDAVDGAAFAKHAATRAAGEVCAIGSGSCD